MSERKVIDCDHCAARNLVAYGRFCIETGRERDVAGGNDMLVTEFDLCSKCMAEWINSSLDAKLRNDRKDVITKFFGKALPER